MRVLVTLWLMLVATVAHAAVERPEFRPQLGARIDLSTPLTDSTRVTSTLAQFTAGRPALVLFGYHNCPNQCGIAQQVIASALAGTGLGDKVVPLFITLAPEEGPADAAGAKERLADTVGLAAAPWQFLSGPAVQQLGEQFGIGAIERERIRQYVHPVAVYTLTPDGRISHVLPGLGVTANDLRLALVEASGGRIGTVIDHIMLWCAGYDVAAGKYTEPIIGVLRLAALVLLMFAIAGVGLLEFGRRRWTA